MTRRLPPELRADLIEFARERIESCWADAGVVPAQVLAENIVLAQEFAWMAHFTPIAPPESRVPCERYIDHISGVKR